MMSAAPQPAGRVGGSMGLVLPDHVDDYAADD
jgi:hypothetical protein